MSETAILRAEIATHEEVYKVQRKIVALMRNCGVEAIFDLCEGIDFIEPVPENMGAMEETVKKVTDRMQRHKDSRIVKTEILKSDHKDKDRFKDLTVEERARRFQPLL